MNIVHTDAIVLRHWDFSDTSLIVSLFTDQVGKIRFLVKGAKNLKNAMRGQMGHFNILKIVFDFHPHKKGLYQIRESKLIKDFSFGKDLKKFYAASYCAELVESLVQEQDQEIEIFNLLLETLENFEKMSQLVISIRRFEIKLLVALGYLSLSEDCPICHKEFENTILLDQQSGWIICRICLRSQSEENEGPERARYIPTSKGILKVAELLNETQGYALKLSERQYHMLKRFTGFYVDLHLAKPLKSRQFLNSALSD